jgi:GNAT superfamily N-acetyltransferase
MSTTCHSNLPEGVSGRATVGAVNGAEGTVNGTEGAKGTANGTGGTTAVAISPNSVEIQPILPMDHADLMALIREFAEFERSPEKVTNSIERMAAEADWLTGFVAKTTVGEIVGYVTFFFAYYSWTGKSLWMDDLYVRPEHRGSGLGRRLIDAVISHARSSGCHKMRWQVSNWNTHAICFYRSLGAQLNDIQLDCHLPLR